MFVASLKFVSIIILMDILINYSAFANDMSTNLNEQQVAATTTATWHAKFIPEKITINMGSQDIVQLNISDASKDYIYHILCENEHIASVQQNSTSSLQLHSNITIDARFIGQTTLYVQRIHIANNSTERSGTLSVIVIRPKRIIDHIFTGAVILVCMLLFINFGAALDLGIVTEHIKRPIGPGIGFFTQFIIMPLLSYGLGYYIFPNSSELQLGLFFTGVSPSGGASNMWTVVLNGNLNLSVLMTSIFNLASFLMMPFWIFTLGHLIFKRLDMAVPYQRIIASTGSLIIALAIGIAIQKCSERFTRVLVRLIKPISTCLILFIIIFAILTYDYLFQLFSWRIIVAGMALPWLGYCLAWLLAKFFRQKSVDALTIAIETGIQNTGISIMLLNVGLEQPFADLTTIVPVTVAIMTPLPLLGIYIYQRCHQRNNNYKMQADIAHETTD